MKADLPSPDRKQIDTLVRVLFKHAAKGSYVSLRSFFDNDSTKTFKINAVPVDNREKVIEAAWQQAQSAARAKQPIVFCPPIATFSNKKRAGKDDVADGLTLTAECDKKTQAARQLLEKLIGPATLIVASGGEWINPATGEIEAKLHLHWRLKKPARGDDRNQLEEARKLVIALVDSDPSHGPISHPIRWPGSIHRKGAPKLCRIVAENPQQEIDLHETLAVLRKAAPAKPDHQARGPINDSPWQQLNSAALANLAAWVPEIFPTARKYHGDGFRVKSKDLGRNLQEDISFTRNGIKDFGVHDMSDPRDGKRTPIDIVMEWKFNVCAEDIARREHTVDFHKAVDWLRKQLGLPQDDNRKPQEHPQENIEPVDLWGQFEPPELPRKLLPKVIEDYAFTTGATMGADPAGLAMAALTVCGAAIDDCIQLQMKKHSDGWQESTRLWTALVGLPSFKKTPAMTAAAKALRKHDHELLRRYQFELKTYQPWKSTNARIARRRYRSVCVWKTPPSRPRKKCW